jgi:superfamily I DNA/RNA helicase
MSWATQGVLGFAEEAEPMSAVVEGLDPAQAQAVAVTEGPVLLIAGPGAGKTLTLVRRTLHVLTAGLAEAGEIVLCTFTEKAALELRDRLRGAAADSGYEGDLSSLRTGTIHGVCNEFVDRYRHLTPLGNAYEVLDELTQSLFLFDTSTRSSDPPTLRANTSDAGRPSGPQSRACSDTWTSSPRSWWKLSA